MGQTPSSWPRSTTLDPGICPRRSCREASVSSHSAAISGCSLLLLHPQLRSRDVPASSCLKPTGGHWHTAGMWHHPGASNADVVAMTGSGRKLKKVRWDVSCQQQRSPLRLEAFVAASTSHSLCSSQVRSYSLSSSCVFLLLQQSGMHRGILLSLGKATSLNVAFVGEPELLQPGAAHGR